MIDWTVLGIVSLRSTDCFMFLIINETTYSDFGPSSDGLGYDELD